MNFLKSTNFISKAVQRRGCIQTFILLGPCRSSSLHSSSWHHGPFSNRNNTIDFLTRQSYYYNKITKVPNINNLTNNLSSVDFYGFNTISSARSSSLSTKSAEAKDDAGVEIETAGRIKKSDISSGPSTEQLDRVRILMEVEIKNFTEMRLEYRIYTRDVILENYWNPLKPRVSKGISKFAINAMKARFYIHFCYPKFQVSISESSINEVDGLVSIGWKIKILRPSKLLSIANITLNTLRKKAKEVSESIHGVSTFRVNDRGYICKHTLTRIQPDPKDDATTSTTEIASKTTTTTTSGEDGKQG